jgi:hypothetical protein
MHPETGCCWDFFCASEKGKLAKRPGRKGTGLNPYGHDSRTAEDERWCGLFLKPKFKTKRHSSKDMGFWLSIAGVVE